MDLAEEGARDRRLRASTNLRVVHVLHMAEILLFFSEIGVCCGNTVVILPRGPTTTQHHAF